MLRYPVFYIIFLFILSFKSVSAIETDWSNGVESQIRLISPYTSNNNQNQIFLGLEYKLKEGWKTYWRSSGEGGFPQNINWESSNNIKDLQILWPTPYEFKTFGFSSLGYMDKVIFPLKIILNNLNENSNIKLDINYVICKDICLPINEILELYIPSGIGKITQHYHTIEKSLSLIPIQDIEITNLKNYNIEGFQDDENVTLVIDIESENKIYDPKFYLDSEFGLPVVNPKISYSNNYKNLIANFTYDKKIISKDNFIISAVMNFNDKSIEFIDDVNIKTLQNDVFKQKSLIYFFLISILGGLILNVMPCVFPVLSLKILSFLNNSRDNKSIRKSFLLTSAGIISSFCILGISLLFLRSVGTNIGWGIQFQQPVFLIFIAIILLIFSINLFGFFEFRTPRFINNKFIVKITSNKSNFRDYFNGFFATILATPCTAPFVGTAITLAFTQSSHIMVSIFFLMGLGMSLPYLFISIFPNLTKFFPKPGIWMIYIKYFLGLLLFGTFIWILTILINNHTFFQNLNQNFVNSDWMTIDDVIIDEKLINDNIIFVDITADWCATCKFNKLNVLNTKKIEKAFEKNNVLKIRGDWTKPNEKINNFLNHHNKFGIPLNVIYTKKYPMGYILSEILSIEEILKILEEK